MATDVADPSVTNEDNDKQTKEDPQTNTQLQNGIDSDKLGLTKEEETELAELTTKFDSLTINKLKNRQRKELQVIYFDFFFAFF